MIRQSIGLLLILLTITACAPTTDTGSTTHNDPIPTREGAGDMDISGDPGSGFGLGDATDGEGFTVEFGGAESGTLSGAGVINCENSVYVLRPSLDEFPQLSLILPSGISPGTYSLTNNTGDGSVASASMFFQDGRVFAANVDGILIISDLATQAGETVSGNFDFSASSNAQTINATGEFEFIAGEDAIYCP